MARAIMASGLLKPKAIRVRSLNFVFVLSRSPLDRRCSRVASIASRCLVRRRPSSTKLGIWQRWAQPSQESSSYLPSSPLSRNTSRSCSLSR